MRHRNQERNIRSKTSSHQHQQFGEISRVMTLYASSRGVKPILIDFGLQAVLHLCVQTINLDYFCLKPRDTVMSGPGDENVPAHLEPRWCWS